MSESKKRYAWAKVLYSSTRNRVKAHQCFICYFFGLRQLAPNLLEVEAWFFSALFIHSGIQSSIQRQLDAFYLDTCQTAVSRWHSSVQTQALNKLLPCFYLLILFLSYYKQKILVYYCPKFSISCCFINTTSFLNVPGSVCQAKVNLKTLNFFRLHNLSHIVERFCYSLLKSLKKRQVITLIYRKTSRDYLVVHYALTMIIWIEHCQLLIYFPQKHLPTLLNSLSRSELHEQLTPVKGKKLCLKPSLQLGVEVALVLIGICGLFVVNQQMTQIFS